MSEKLPPGHGVDAHKDKMGKVMHEFKRGQLHSGTGKKGRKGKVVKSREQAIAIGLSYVEKLMAMGYSEEAAITVASFMESRAAADLANEGPTSDIDSSPGKQKGNSGRKKEDPQGSVATFPTIPHAERGGSDGGVEAIQNSPCPPKKSEAEKQAEKAQQGTQPTQPQQPQQQAQQPQQPPQPEDAAKREAAKQKAERCRKERGN